MVTTWCPTLSADLASILVDQAHERFFEQGTEVYNLALQALYDMNNVGLTPRPINVSFDYVDPQSQYQRPQRPTIDEAALEFRDPNIPIGPAPVFTRTPLQFDEAPVIDDTPPTLSFVPRPDAPDVVMPTAPQRADAIDMPVPPDFVLPEAPTLDSLQLPDLPQISLPEFTTPRPELVDPGFVQDWTFQPEPYTQVLVNDLVETLRPMIRASEALPQIIERAIFERMRSRIDVDAQAEVDQAFNEFAARGFSEPPGQLSGRVSEIRQRALHAKAEASRDAMIKQFEETLAQQRFAITQGAALEGVLVQLHIEEQRFLLEAAKFQMESALAALNYRVTMFKAEMDAYQVDAQVLRDKIQAELAKIELYRAQMEGERIRGELNRQKVEIYNGMIASVNAMASFYRTQVEAVEVQAKINMQEIERYKAELSAFETVWNAHVAQWRGYAAAIEGESKRVDVYKAMVDANAKRVDAWAARNNFKMDEQRLLMQQHALDLDVWRAGLERLRTMVGAEQARLSAVAAAAGAKATMYQADAQIESAASAAADRTFELGLRRAQADLEAQLKVADMEIQQAQFLLAQLVEIQKAKAQIAGQLAASTMSAVNYGASVSSGNSRGTSCSTNFSFSGEIVDAGI